MSEQTWLRCTITPGQFTGEYAAEGTSHNGTGFSLFVGDEHLECRSFPVGADRASALLEVRVLEKGRGLALIELPVQTLENGKTVTVSEGDLECRKVRQKA